MSITLTTPEAINAFAHLQRYYALKLEVDCPGLKHSKGSIMNLIRNSTGITKRTKKGVLEEYGKLLRGAGILT